MHTQVSRKLSVLRQPDGASAIAPWAIVLAGGEGLRLRPLVRQLCGDDARSSLRRSSGSKSLLGHTPAQRILAQSQDRGTAAGILFLAHWIHSQDPRALRQGSRGQWEELIPVVSVFALQGFLAPYTERSPGDDLQAPLPDFPLTARANSKGIIPDAPQGGLNLPARRGFSSKVHQGNVSLCGEEALFHFVGARLDGDSVSALPLVGEFSQFVGKNTGELLGLGG